MSDHHENISSMNYGKLIIQFPKRIDMEEIEDIERIFELTLRLIRRTSKTHEEKTAAPAESANA